MDEGASDQPPALETNPWRMGRGAWLRAVRAGRRLSQRDLADRAGVPSSTIARIETGAVTPSLATVQHLLATTGYELAIRDNHGHIVALDPERELLRDDLGRRFPPHLPYGPTPGSMRYDQDGRDWWGWMRVAWPGPRYRVPTHTYWRRLEPCRLEGHDADRPSEYGRVWDDAT